MGTALGLPARERPPSPKKREKAGGRGNAKASFSSPTPKKKDPHLFYTAHVWRKNNVAHEHTHKLLPTYFLNHTVPFSVVFGFSLSVFFFWGGVLKLLLTL
jgi:hypothetical protein